MILEVNRRCSSVSRVFRATSLARSSESSAYANSTDSTLAVLPTTSRSRDDSGKSGDMTTFDTDVGAVLKAASATGAKVRVMYEMNGDKTTVHFAEILKE